MTRVSAGGTPKEYGVDTNYPFFETIPAVRAGEAVFRVSRMQSKYDDDEDIFPSPSSSTRYYQLLLDICS